MPIVQPNSTTWFNFYMDMWLYCEIDEAGILSKVPRRLTQEEAETIINTPRDC